jgi:phosphotransferase system HPr (HPr) family protein
MFPSSERTVRLPADLHARPAGQVSQTAARLSAKVTLAVGEREIEARSVLLVMQLGATKDTEVTVRAEGEDAAQAVEAIASILAAVDSETAAASG